MQKTLGLIHGSLQLFSAGYGPKQLSHFFLLLSQCTGSSSHPCTEVGVGRGVDSRALKPPKQNKRDHGSRKQKRLQAQEERKKLRREQHPVTLKDADEHLVALTPRLWGYLGRGP